VYACVVDSRGGVYTCREVRAATKKCRCAGTKTTCTQVVIVLRGYSDIVESERIRVGEIDKEGVGGEGTMH